MARERGFDGDFRRLKVADLADHDDVRVLAQESAQGHGEVQADLVVHLHLLMPDKLYSTGSSAVLMLVVVWLRSDSAEYSVVVLPEPVGPVTSNHSPRLTNGPLEVVERCLVEAELGHVELQVALVQEAQNDLLAELRGHDRNAEVHLAILRPA